MSRPSMQFTIRRIMDLVAIIAIAMALVLRFSAETWSIILTSTTLATLGAAVLGARFQRGRVRAFCVGAALAGGAYFLWFASPTLARGAVDPGRRISQSLVTIPVAAAGGSAARFCYDQSSRLLTAQHRRCAKKLRERGSPQT
jgi:hypothetical protein